MCFLQALEDYRGYVDESSLSGAAADTDVKVVMH